MNVPRGSRSGRQDAVRTETKRPDAPGMKTPSRHSVIGGASNYRLKTTISRSKADLADKAGESSVEIRTLESLKETAKLTIHTYKASKIIHFHMFMEPELSTDMDIRIKCSIAMQQICQVYHLQRLYKQKTFTFY